MILQLGLLFLFASLLIFIRNDSAYFFSSPFDQFLLLGTRMTGNKIHMSKCNETAHIHIHHSKILSVFGLSYISTFHPDEAIGREYDEYS